MATAPTITTVPVDAMPTFARGVLQVLVGEHLRKYAAEYGYAVAAGCRIENVKSARDRIPDVLLCMRPIPRTKTVETVPLAVIEILSPDDRLINQLVRFREYRARGVHDIIILDPESLTAARYPHMEDPVTFIELPDGRTVPFPADELLETLRRELE